MSIEGNDKVDEKERLTAALDAVSRERRCPACGALTTSWRFDGRCTACAHFGAVGEPKERGAR